MNTLLKHITTFSIALSLSLTPVANALANQDQADQQDQETSKGLNDKLKETGTKIIKDAAISTAKAIAASAASTAAKSAGSFGIGGALDGAAKAAAAVQVGIETATAAKNAKAIADSAKTMPLIVSIIMGLTGIVAVVKCRKADKTEQMKNSVKFVTTNIPAPSFYLWALSSVAYMVSEIVHFIKFKQLGRKVASMSLGSDSKEQSQALKQQLELLKNTKDLAKKKLTWQQIVMAGYIASEVAAIAELAIWIATATTEGDTRFLIQCNKDDQKKEENKTEEKSCGPGGLRGIASDGLKAGGNSLKGGVTSSVGSTIDAKSDELADKTINKKKYERQAKKEQEKLEKERLEKEKNAKPAEETEKSDTDGNNSSNTEEEETEEGDTEEEEEEEFLSKFHFSYENFQSIADNHYKVIKHNLEVEIQSRMIMNLYLTANTNPLIKTLLEARSSTDAYYLFDEWNREHANALISASIDDYKTMAQNRALEDALDHDEKNSFGKMIAASLSATKGAMNFFPTACAADGAGDSCGGGKKAGAAIKEFLVDFVLDRIFGLAGSFKDKGMEKLSEQMDKKVHGKNAALTEEDEEKIAEQEEALNKEAEAVDEKISEIDTTAEDDKLEAIKDARAAKRETAAEQAAEAKEEQDETEEESSDESANDSEEEEEEEEISENYSDEELDRLEKEALANKQEKEEKIKKLEEEKKAKEQKVEDHAKKVEQDEIDRQKYENSLMGKGKTKAKDFALEKADEGYSELEDLGREKLKGLVIKDKNKNKDAKASTGNANDKKDGPKTDVKGDVRDKTNADAKGLKGKITQAWTKVGEILEKFFKTEAKRMGLGAASILVVKLASDDTKKNISTLEQQINDTQKIVDELDGIKSTGQMIAGSVASSSDYAADSTGRQVAGLDKNNNSAQGRIPYTSMNNICFQGVGSQMRISGCECRNNNSCTSFDRIKIDPGAFPNGVGSGYSSISSVNDKLLSGNYSGATLEGMGLARNAIKMLNQRDNMRKKLSKIMKDHGHAPIKYDKEALSVVGKIYDGVVESGSLDAMNEIRGLNSASSRLENEQSQDSYMKFTPNATSSDAGNVAPKNNNIFDPFGSLVDNEEEIALENLEDVMPKIDDYDLNANSDVQNNPSASIFDIISSRYMKTGYPVLLKNRAPASQPKTGEEMNQK